MGRTIVPIGPYHPLQEEPEFFTLTVEGEKVVDIDVKVGYNHRGIEKLSEMKTFDQSTFVIERICGICSTSHPFAYTRAVEDIINEFKSADKYVTAVPMWNFHIPYRLKHYIDIIVQPTYTFNVTPEGGYKGLVTGKPLFIAYSRGGEYSQGSQAEAFDFQTKYLEFILTFIGFTDIRSLVIEPTLAAGPDTAKEKRETGIAKAKEMAKSF